MTAIYARQSIDKKDSLSIEAQIEYCKRFAGEDVKVFKDKVFSGKNTNRPAFTELIKAVEAGQIETIFHIIIQSDFFTNVFNMLKPFIFF